MLVGTAKNHFRETYHVQLAVEYGVPYGKGMFAVRDNRKDAKAIERYVRKCIDNGGAMLPMQREAAL